MKGALKPEAAAALIPEGASLMIGGFMAVGTPERLIDALVARGVGKLTIIANDTAMPGKGIGKLVSAGLVARVITSHIGLNPHPFQGVTTSRACLMRRAVETWALATRAST